MTSPAPARPRGRTLALAAAGAAVIAAAVIGFAQWEAAQARDTATNLATAPAATTTASLRGRPLPQVRFVDAVGTEYQSLLSRGWERVLDAAEATCRDQHAGVGEPLVADAAAQRFAVPGRTLDMSDGMRLVRLLDDLRVCASFGLA
jgi:hypothetical protein